MFELEKTMAHLSPFQFRLLQAVKFVTSWQGAVFGSLVMLAVFGLAGMGWSQWKLHQLEHQVEDLKFALAEAELSAVSEKQPIQLQYQFSQGDTLWQLAKDTYGCGEAYQLLAVVNGIADPDQVSVGQVVTLLASSQARAVCGAESLIEENSQVEASSQSELYSQSQEQDQNFVTVQAGDSLWSLAEQHLGDGMRWSELYRENRTSIGDCPDLMYPGAILVIPDQIR